MRLRSKEFDVKAFSKEELLFLHCYGKPDSGIFPYARMGAYNDEILSGVYAALRIAIAKRMF